VVVPQRYVERVGEDASEGAVGAGPYKFVSLRPGVELVLEAFDGYWRGPAIKAWSSGSCRTRRRARRR